MKQIFEKKSDRILARGSLSDDRLKCFLDVEPLQPGIHVERAEILELLRGEVPVDDVNVGVLDDIAATITKGEKALERRILKGTEPEPGLDGRLVFMVKRRTELPEVTEDEKGFASFRDMNLFENIQVGTALARIYPPKAGKDGRDALGKPLPAKAGKPIKVQLDKTVKTKAANEKEPYQTIIADAEGFLSEKGDKLAIQTELVIDGNVDFHIGSFAFIGKVVVRGDVMPEFRVEGKKGVSVSGSVLSSLVTSAQGDVEVKAAVVGKEGEVRCKGEARCGSVREARLTAGASVQIKNEAADANINSQGTVRVDRVLVGGDTRAVCGVEAQEIGNEVNVKTSVTLCSDVEMTAEYQKLRENIASHERALHLIELHLGPYALNPARVVLLQRPHRQRMEQLIGKQNEVKKSLIKLNGELDRLKAQARTNSTLRVNIQKKAYDGTVIYAEGKKFEVKGELQGPVSVEFDSATGEFSTGELKALECALNTDDPNTRGGAS